MRGPVAQYRTVFVSDLHLGSAGSKCEDVQRFLWSFESDYLFLVGDIFDGWVGKGQAKWSQGCTNVLRTILGKSKHGCKVCYTPGNHDAFMRRLNGSELGNVLIDHSFIHDLADGRELLVVHGDLFDRSCTTYTPVAWAGAWAYEYMTLLNLKVNRGLTKREYRTIDFSAALKLACKRLIKRGSSFENQLLEAARQQDCQGVACGHVHRPAVRECSDGMLYINTGDWVENRTAVVEHLDGRIELLRWVDIEASVPENRDKDSLADPDFIALH